MLLQLYFEHLAVAQTAVLAAHELLEVGGMPEGDDHLLVPRHRPLAEAAEADLQVVLGLAPAVQLLLGAVLLRAVPPLLLQALKLRPELRKPRLQHRPGVADVPRGGELLRELAA
eukprot:CAMPEP_0118957330 /NCGR_PEP_ID=MMETSP1169-20130426/62043_1 /TAXON_ID=36882 /ORGANISM="Pyramimonas obovata, Strain CCMP722" /LENGTH=114 /DNA_ID=CAMNT_0006905395 /DNA_START=759 /DNA_END=1100 /DNA_ORIENTATION=+